MLFEDGLLIIGTLAGLDLHGLVMFNFLLLDDGGLGMADFMLIAGVVGTGMWDGLGIVDLLLLAVMVGRLSLVVM